MAETEIEDGAHRYEDVKAGREPAARPKKTVERGPGAIDVNGVRVGLDGWISAQTADGRDVHLRVGLGADDQITVISLLIEGSAIDTDALRSVHPSRMLAAVGDLEVATVDKTGQKIPAMPVSTLLRRIARGDELDRDDSDLTLGKLRARAVEQIRAAPRPLLGRPTSNPDEFYRRLAAAYRSAASESGRPAIVLAEENGVPAETVRRWVKEARRQGLLPAGRKGRAL